MATPDYVCAHTDSMRNRDGLFSSERCGYFLLWSDLFSKGSEGVGG